MHSLKIVEAARREAQLIATARTVFGHSEADGAPVLRREPLTFEDVPELPPPPKYPLWVTALVWIGGSLLLWIGGSLLTGIM